MTNAYEINALPSKIEAARRLLDRIAGEFAPAALSSGLGPEGMVLTDLVLGGNLPIEIFTLDTGRLPPETYALIDAVHARYGVRLHVYLPATDALERYLNHHGVNGFYGGVEARKACCHVRKVEPLRRALAGKRAWISGLRRGQSAARSEVPVAAFDAAHGLMKFNPLADWSEREVWSYIRDHGVPYNALHDRGFPSIGCAPCTRAITAGEDARAGRWWWETAGPRECGLHEHRVNGSPVAA